MIGLHFVCQQRKGVVQQRLVTKEQPIEETLCGHASKSCIDGFGWMIEYLLMNTMWDVPYQCLQLKKRSLVEIPDVMPQVFYLRLSLVELAKRNLHMHMLTDQ